MATQGDIEKALVMDILVKHFEKQKNKHVNNTEFHDAIMRAWPLISTTPLLMRFRFMRQPCSSILQGESAILTRAGRGLGLDQCCQSSSVFGKRSMPATRKLQQ